MKSFKVNGRTIGPQSPTYIVAEISANHNQEFERAVRIIEAAASAGADAVKLQTYTPDTITIDCDATPFRIKGTLWEGRTLYDLYAKAYTPWEWQPRLMRIANDLGLDLFSTPFDPSAVDFLEDIGVPLFKVASFENNDIPLLRKIARTGKPIIMSTGMATLAELDEAVRAIRAEGRGELALLKAVSAYPAPPAEMNLRTIPHLADTFSVVAGLSDHTHGISVPIAAVTLGARIVEKHLTLARSDGGPDSAFSLEPNEFKSMVTAVRTVEEALGEITYEPTEKERESRVFRRSLFVVADMRAGEPFSPANVRSIRPGGGLPPRYYDEVLGRVAAGDLTRGTPLRWQDIS